MASGGLGEDSTERIRVRFGLERDEEGWPPVDSEEIWAIALGSDVARVDSIPWFVQNIALGDLISVRSVNERQAAYLEKLRWSGNCTLRVVPLAEDSEAGLRDVVQQLSHYDIEVEVLGQFGIVAANVRPSVDLVRVKRMLDLGEEQGRWSYEEGCVGGSWPS